MSHSPSCLRCEGFTLIRLQESSPEIDFFKCLACHRQYAKKPTGSLQYRWGHPVTLALYGVQFDSEPVARAESQAEHIMRGSWSRAQLVAMIDEIDLELMHPTQSVRECLPGSVASEERYREYLRAFTACIRGHLA